MMMRLRVRAAVLLTVCAAVVVSVTAQQPAAPDADVPPVTFRVEVNYVEVDVFVTDDQGNPVQGLTVDDFEVLEDGVRQEVSAFSSVNIPLERPERPLFAAEAIEPDVLTNASGEGRIYAIVLDDWHVDPRRSSRVKDALRRFIEEDFGSNDLAAVVYLSGRADDGQDFTSNTRLLLESIDKFTGWKLISTTQALTQDFNRPAISGSGAFDMVRDPEEFERAWRARTAMDSIRRLSDFLAGVRGRRKAMILMSEGVGFNIFDGFNINASIVAEQSREAIAAATRANVTIYAIDPRGLATAEELVLAGNSPSADRPGIRIGLESFGDELRLSQGSLRTLSEQTGGFAAVNQNTFADTFDRIVRENSAYYVLGYYSTNERRDGSRRSLDVRVGRPGLQVRARNNYIAARGRAPDSDAVVEETPRETGIREALTSPLAVTQLPLRVFAAPYKGTAPNAQVAVALEIDVSRLNFAETDGVFSTTISVALTVSGPDGDLVANRQHNLDLALQPTTLTSARQQGLRVVSMIDLPPGRHRLRVVAVDDTGVTGSVDYDLDIPVYGEELFAISGVTLTAASADAMPTVLALDPLEALLPGPPVALREFDQGDELDLYAEVYESAAGFPEHSVDISTSLIDERGRVLFEADEERSSDELVDGQGGYGYMMTVPLDVEPGLYVIRVEARPRLVAMGPALSRDILIRVR